MKKLFLLFFTSLLYPYLVSAQVFETGAVTVDQPNENIWFRVDLKNTYALPPVIITSPLTEFGEDPAQVRIRNVTTTSFEYQIEEFEYLTRGHKEESFSYLVVEQGRHIINGQVWEAGIVSGNTDGSFKSVSFAPPAFGSIPIVFTQLASDNDPTAAVLRTDVITTDGFKLKIYEEEASTDPTRTAADDVYYLAVQASGGFVGSGSEQRAYEVGTIPIDDQSYRHERKVSFGSAFSQPILLAAAQNTVGGDPFWLRYRELYGEGVSLRLQEEDSDGKGELSHADEEVGYLVLEGGTTDRKRLLWAEYFSLPDQTISDGGPTAWTTELNNLGSDGDNYFEVRSDPGLGTRLLAAKNTDGEVIWRSETIDISGYVDVKVSAYIRGDGPPDMDGHLQLYYSIDGGPETPWLNGLQRGRFDPTTAMADGLNGNTLRLIIKVRNTTDDDYYKIDNIRVYTESNDRYSIQDGDWNDPDTWSYTPGGAPCDCLPDQLSSTHIDGYTVSMTARGDTRNLTVYSEGLLQWTVDNQDLFLYGNATLDVKNGGEISVTTSSNLTFVQWNTRHVDHDTVRSGVGLAGVNAVINVDTPTGFRAYELSLDAVGQYTIQGNGDIYLSNDLDINNRAEVTNNLNGNIDIAESLQLGYPEIVFTNNGRIVAGDALQQELDDTQFVNYGRLEVDAMKIFPNAISGSLFTNQPGAILLVNSVTDLDNQELTIHNYGTIKTIGSISNVEVGKGLFHNHTGAIWTYGGDNYDEDLWLFTSYENNEFEYNGVTDQKIFTPQDGAYWHLVLSNRNNTGDMVSVKSPTANVLDINGSLTMIGTAEGNVRFDISETATDVTVGGNWWQDERSGVNSIQYQEGINNETVTFDGTDDQRIRTYEEFLNITVDKPSGRLLVENSSRIAKRMTFTDGIVTVENNAPLVLRKNAQALQASDASHIVGKVTKQGNANFTFPVGDGIQYHPLTVSNLSEEAHLTAEYLATYPADVANNPNNMANFAACGYWQLIQAAGSTEANVTLHWNPSTCSVDVDEVVVVRWDGSRWVSEGRNSTTANSVTSDKITDFGLFTLAELTDIPVAEDDVVSTPEDTALEVNILANDSDNNGLDNTSVSIVSDVQYGQVTVDPATGRIRYTPNEHFHGTDALVYTVLDNKGVQSNRATLTITVIPINDAPVAADDAATTNFRTVLNGPSVLTNDRDVEDITLTASLLSLTIHGTLNFSPDGTYVYTPNASFSGIDSFTYQACDAGTPSACATATVTITVRSFEVVNQAPVAQNDQFTTDEDMPLSGNVLTNDIEPDGELLAVDETPVQNTEHGTLVFSDNGTFVYTPSADFSGTDRLTYRVCDNAGLCDTAQVTITVAPVNDPPVAINDTVIVTEGAPGVRGNVLANDYSIDGDVVGQAILTISPSFGTVVLNRDGSFTYTPRSVFTGEDRFVYRMCDDQVPTLCAEASVVVVVSVARILHVAKGFSPNNDQTNDVWVIEGIRAYPDNIVKVFNRWGNVVYQAQGYDNLDTVWRGEARRGALLGSDQVPEGTYFYVIALGDRQKPLSGYLILKR